MKGKVRIYHTETGCVAHCLDTDERVTEIPPEMIGEVVGRLQRGGYEVELT